MSHADAQPRAPRPNPEPHWNLQPASSVRWDQSGGSREATALLQDQVLLDGESYELAPLPLLTLDGHGLICQANLAASELLGSKVPDLLGCWLASFIDAEARPGLWQSLASAASDGSAAPQLIRARLVSGSTPIELTLRGSPQHRGTIYASAVNTSQRERDARERDELRHAVESKERVLAMLSHELRTPLTPALAMAAKMSRTASLSGELHRSLELIERSLRTEARLIDDLLDAAAIGHGVLRVQRHNVEVHALLAESVEAARLLADKKQVALRFTPAATTFQANADPLRLQQVFANLLTNALKYTPAGGSVHVGTHAQRDRLAIEFRDTGLGFSEDDSTHLFLAFDQLPQPGRPRGGLGLGLAICRALLELQDGTISATSPGPGQGASFVVELPASVSA